MSDILDILRHQHNAPKALRTIEQCRESLFDAILKAADEIERLRIKNKKLKKKLKNHE